MKIVYVTALVLAAFALHVPAEELASGPIEPQKHAEFYQYVFKQFEKPEVTVYRIASPEKVEGGEKLPQLYKWAVLEEKELDAKKFRKLQEMLCDKDKFGREWAGCFRPGFAFRIKDGDQQVDLLFCLQCNYVEYHKGKETFMWPLSEEGHNKFFDLYKAIFPKAGK